MLPQEAEVLVELSGEVQRPYQVTAVTTGRYGAAVAVAGPGGQRETVQARYVIGADGMQSAIREAMGIGFTGGRYGQSFVLADVRMDWPLSSEEVQLFFSPAGLVVVAPLPGGHHRVVATVDSAPEHITRGDVRTLLDERGPGRARVHELVWESRFRVHHRVTDAYRRGPALLAGDADTFTAPPAARG